MRFLLAGPWKLVTITTVITVITLLSLLGASAITQFSSYQFDRSLAQRSEYIISSSLQHGGLPFAMATQDKDAIRSIVENHLSYEEIYAIDIKDSSGHLIHRAERNISDSLKISPRTYIIQSPFENVAIDSFEEVDEEETKALGMITIYFSTEHMDKPIINQAVFTGGVLIFAILVIALVLYSFNRYISEYLARTIQVMGSIEKGHRVDMNEKHRPSIEELRVIFKSLKHLSETIYERDTRLKESLDEALQAKISAQKAEEFKDDFIRAISHDIRTPVGVVVNLLELVSEEISRREVDDTLSDKIRACHQSAKILGDITSELFNLEQFQRRELIDSREETDLYELFSRIQALYERKFSEKGLSFGVCIDQSIDPSDVPYVRFDRRKITLIIENIVDNALKFTKTGSVAITWGVSGDKVRVRIKDSGIGIPEEKLELIFNKHTQVENPVTNRHEGRGLGLYYVKRLADVIGAEIKVYSMLGIGTVFELDIPFDEGGQADTQVNKGEGTSNLKALIIDDDENTCFTLAQMLGQHGIISSSECIPEIGLSRLLKETPDLVFIDYHMPGLSGDKLAQKAQSLLAPNATFFVCITAESNMKAIGMLGDIFQQVYRKPFDPAELRAIVENVSQSKQVTRDILATIKSFH